MTEPVTATRWERAFSTLGCPDADVHAVARLARTHGCTGVELRCAPPEGLLTPRSSPAERAAVKAHLASVGVRALWLASYVRVADDTVEDSECLARLGTLLELAAEVGALGVRVFPGAPGPGPAGDACAVRRLRAAADRAAEAGTRLLLETHDSHPAARDVARVLDAVGHPAVGAVWDVLHTWRAGEGFEESAGVLTPWLDHVQIKDVAAYDDPRPLLPGTGAVPLAELPAALAAVDYRGWLCLEWEKRWFPQAPELSEALRYAAL
ncbi:sugar phosphate isomerase/epimerase family protein [Streptomyces sp. NPDC058867]|uniref:sugar phosphate isomerase/epimerase family protein n=1 Tax=unclassified Streptomyces TaxID=2593676 RepID=UPI00368DF012